MSSEPLSGQLPHPMQHSQAPLVHANASPVAKAAVPQALQMPQAPHAPAAPHAEPPPQPKFDPEENFRQLQEVVEKMNEEMLRNGRNLAFSIEKSLNRVVVSVKTADTGEVIRQIPDEAVLRFAHTVDRIKGLMHNAQT